MKLKAGSVERVKTLMNLQQDNKERRNKKDQERNEELLEMSLNDRISTKSVHPHNGILYSNKTKQIICALKVMELQIRKKESQFLGVHF